MGKHIEVHVVLALGLALTGGAGCFQQLDTGATGGPENSTEFPPSGGGDAGASLPAPFTKADLQTAESASQACAPGSQLCYQLCGSPSCALKDNTIPTNLGSTPALLPDGGDAPSSCDQINALALKIRQRSCSACHGSPPGQAGFDWILDDSKISTMAAPANNNKPAVIAGDPENSIVMQRIRLRLSGAPDPTGMPPAPGQLSIYVGPSVVSTIVYPTAEDYSVLYTWIMACVPDADAGAFGGSYYGGNYGPASLDGGDQ